MYEVVKNRMLLIVRQKISPDRISWQGRCRVGAELTEPDCDADLVVQVTVAAV